MPLWRLAEQFAQSVDECRDDRALSELVADVARELGFDHFAIVHGLSFRIDTPRLIKIDNYPAYWSERFALDRLYLDDPILLASQRAGRGFHWGEVARFLHIEHRHRLVLDAASAHGLGDGFTLPIHIPGEPAGSCSFAQKPGRAMSFRDMHCAGVIGGFAFEAARRIHGFDLLPDIIPHFSPRQRDCLHLLVRGWSNKQIARALNLSPETVHVYVKSARAQLGVSSRTLLVVEALRLGLIHFDEAIHDVRYS